PIEVDELEHAAHPVDPPAVAGAGHRLPVVKRVAPELPEGAEVVRRCPGSDLVEGEEQVGVRGVVAAFGRDVDRDVPDDPYAPRGSVGAEHAPLAVEAHLLGDRAVARERLPVGEPAPFTLRERTCVARRYRRVWLGG